MTGAIAETFSRLSQRPCPCCGGAGVPLLVVTDDVSGADFEARRCSECELVYLSDPPVPADLGRFYDNTAGASMHHRPSPLVEKARSVAMRWELKALDRHLRPGAVVLDFGAGDGSLTRVMRAAGYRALAAYIYPAERWTVPAVPYHQFAPSFEPEELFATVGPVDAITMRHVLEHVLEPRQLLAGFARSQVDLVSVVVPNVGSRLSRRLGRAWYYWDPPRHITFFTPDTLVTCARRAGYDVVEIRLVGLDEVVTSTHRSLLLRQLRGRGGAATERLARLTRPTGLLASGSSAAVAPFGTATIKAILKRRD